MSSREVCANPSKLTIALDCDGVLFDCTGYVHKLAERITGRQLPPPSENKYFEFDKAFGLSDDEWAAVQDAICSGKVLGKTVPWTPPFEVRPTRDMSFLPGAIGFVGSLIERGHDVFFLTSHWRDCESWVTDRELRLNAWFPQCDVVFAHNKIRVQFDLLLDDKPSTVLSMPERAVMFTQPWNESVTGVMRADTYEQFLRRVDEWLVYAEVFSENK